MLGINNSEMASNYLTASCASRAFKMLLLVNINEMASNYVSSGLLLESCMELILMKWQVII